MASATNPGAPLALILSFCGQNLTPTVSPEKTFDLPITSTIYPPIRDSRCDSQTSTNYSTKELDKI